MYMLQCSIEQGGRDSADFLLVLVPIGRGIRFASHGSFL